MRAVLLDLDGVIYDGERPIPGAAQAVAWLRSQRIPHLFVSNTTSRPRAALVSKLATHGIPADPRQILTPAVAAARWLSERGTQGATALFVPAPTVEDFAGVTLLADDAESGAGFVVVGDLGEQWSFARLNRAFRLLVSNPRADLVALGMTRFWRAEDGLRLDVAPFVTALQHATGRAPVVLGKPAPDFFAAALAQLCLPAHEVAMVGDDLEVDVAGAQRVGIRGLLVRTGKASTLEADSPARPDAVLESIGALPDWWAVQ